jgi:acyl carrier protein
MSSDATPNASFNDLRSLFAETFKVDPSEIGPETQLGEFPAWDSMGHMDLMVGLESRFGVEINAETISQLISIPAILAYIQNKSHA